MRYNRNFNIRTLIIAVEVVDKLTKKASFGRFDVHCVRSHVPVTAIICLF